MRKYFQVEKIVSAQNNPAGFSDPGRVFRSLYPAGFLKYLKSKQAIVFRSVNGYTLIEEINRKDLRS